MQHTHVQRNEQPTKPFENLFPHCHASQALQNT